MVNKAPHPHADPEPQRAIGCPYAKCATKVPPSLAVFHFGNDWYVYCRSCGGSGPYAHNEAEAVQLWNDRNLQVAAPVERRMGPLARVFWWVVIFIATTH